MKRRIDMDSKDQKKPEVPDKLFLHSAIAFGAIGLLLGNGVTEWTDGAVQYGAFIGAFVGTMIGVLFARFA